MEKTLTVFTPSYNRAHTLGRTYESLCRQTCKDFEWLVVDDGSTDGTRELVAQWQSRDCGFPIRYIHQENQGMHGAHNTAYANIRTELNTCIDSDDYMLDDAVEKIVAFWGAHGSKEVAGIIGLDIKSDGEVIGTRFASSGELVLLYGSGIKGDKKLVLRTSVAKEYPPYPMFEGEKYVSLGYKYQVIEQDYKWLTLNEPLVVVEYQLDGSSYNMFRQYWNNPRGFAFIHNTDLLYVHDFKRRIMVATHYVSHCLRSHDCAMIFRSNSPWLTTLCLLPGVLLYVYTWYKVRVGAVLRHL